ncbi:hypothetical protein CVM52_14390 [Pseudooceanicola lipolyticus]|uniref:Uncharacterized protein n=1 Tax=Pseudooceanicola lipolyticus TaxID=2029104 RepID=A0A2M8IZN8_9RHOB|nr:hypothetical protein CVM52_14390 [Pseudooceanicola lipolyticus]
MQQAHDEVAQQGDAPGGARIYIAVREGPTSIKGDPMQPTEPAKTSPQEALALLDEAWAYYTPADDTAPAWDDQPDLFDYADVA